MDRRKTKCLCMGIYNKIPEIVTCLTGLIRLIDQALGKEVKVAVCSTSNEKAVCINRFYNILLHLDIL